MSFVLEGARRLKPLDRAPACLTLCAVLLAGCGGTNSQTSTIASGTGRGTLIQDPPYRIASLNAADLGAQLTASPSGARLLQLAGAPRCGVDVYDFQYYTVGARAELATASGALMVPTGAAPLCSGSRPIVLYAHGTQANQAANLADITNTANTEGVMIAAVFAAQGWIVVAPNYAGYDISSLEYHPFLDGDQQSKDMLDALQAARTALPGTFAAATSDSGKLFVTGYSQGGYVAMATQRALQQAGTPATAAAPMSGPYALAAFGDTIMYGGVNIGSTIFVPMLINSYQQAYGNLYGALTDIYDPAYAGNATFAAAKGDVLPSTTPIATLYQDGVLPRLALFNSSTPGIDGTPGTGNAALDGARAVPSTANFPSASAAQLALWDTGFGSPALISTAYRVNYVQDALAHPDGAVPAATTGLPTGSAGNALRAALAKNDLRGFLPQSPTLLCGGDQDPTVFFSVNTQLMRQLWTAQGLAAPQVNYVDVDPAGGASGDPAIAQLQGGFQQTLAGISAAAGGGSAGQSAVVQAYHTSVAPFCAVAARSFFGNFL